MAYANVIVRSVDELSRYHARLTDKKQKIKTLLEELTTDCDQQGRNWEDGQYQAFQQKLETYITGADNQLQELQETIDMVAAVLRRLQ